MAIHLMRPATPLRILCLAGDGIGPEIMSATCAVLDAVADLLDRPIDLSHAVIGFDALAEEGSTIPDAVIKSARAADGVILGPVSHNDYPPVADGGLNPSGCCARNCPFLRMSGRREAMQICRVLLARRLTLW